MFRRSISFLAVFCIALAAFFAPAAHAQRSPPAPISIHMALGNPDVATTDPRNSAHWLSVREWFALSYSNPWREPVWVGWHLSAADIGSAPRDPTFVADSLLPATFVHITSADYDNAGYDRGHMCDSKDRTVSVEANDSAFTMANIVPQLHTLNAGAWLREEAYCRTLVAQGNDLFILCGPVIKPGYATISKDQIAVPAATWKVVVVVPSGPGDAASRITDSCRVIATIMPNDASATLRDDWHNYRVTTAAIEQATGLHFFTALPAPIAEHFETEVDTEP